MTPKNNQDRRTRTGRERHLRRHLLDADASRYQGPRLPCGAPDRRSRAGREWGALQEILTLLEDGAGAVPAYFARGYRGRAKRDGSPDLRTREGRVWQARAQLCARLGAQQYAGRTKRDGTPDFRTREGREWAARCQLLQAVSM